MKNGATVLMRIRRAQMKVTTDRITVRTDTIVTTIITARRVAVLSVPVDMAIAQEMDMAIVPIVPNVLASHRHQRMEAKAVLAIHV